MANHRAYRLMLHLALTVPSVFTAQGATATALVGILAEDGLLMAADSRERLFGGGDNRVLHVNDNVCKIRVIRKTLFGMAGLKVDVVGRFSYQDAITEVLRNRGSLRDALKTIADELKPKSLEFLKRLRRDDPAAFALETSKAWFLDVLIGAFEGRRPAMMRVVLKAKVEGDRLRVDREFQCENGCPGKFARFALGEVTGRDFDANPPVFPLHEYARSIVSLKVSDPSVGGPSLSIWMRQ